MIVPLARKSVIAGILQNRPGLGNKTGAVFLCAAMTLDLQSLSRKGPLSCSPAAPGWVLSCSPAAPGWVGTPGTRRDLRGTRHLRTVVRRPWRSRTQPGAAGLQETQPGAAGLHPDPAGGGWATSHGPSRGRLGYTDPAGGGWATTRTQPGAAGLHAIRTQPGAAGLHAPPGPSRGRLGYTGPSRGRLGYSQDPAGGGWATAAGPSRGRLGYRPPRPSRGRLGYMALPDPAGERVLDRGPRTLSDGPRLVVDMFVFVLDRVRRFFQNGRPAAANAHSQLVRTLDFRPGQTPMRMPVTLLIAIGKAGLNLAGVGMAGDIADIARAIWKLWPKQGDERREEFAAIAGADDRDYQADVVAVVAQVAGDQSESVRREWESRLRRVQVQVRQAAPLLDSPTGRTIRPGLVLEKPEGLIPFLAPVFQGQPSRFQPGDRPVPGIELGAGRTAGRRRVRRGLEGPPRERRLWRTGRLQVLHRPGGGRSVPARTN